MTEKTLTEKELELLFPIKETIHIAGREFIIRPFNITETEIAVTELGTLIPVFKQMHADNQLDSENIGVMLGTFTESISGIKKIIAMCLNVDEKGFVDLLDTATFIEITSAIIRVNKVFFSDRIEKAIVEATNLLPKAPLEN